MRQHHERRAAAHDHIEFKKVLLDGRGRVHAEKLAATVADNKKRFDMLMSILDGTDRLAGQRAAHVLQLVGERYPHLLGPHIGVLFQLLDQDVHESVQRVAVRSLHYAPLAIRWKAVVFTRMLTLIVVGPLHSGHSPFRSQHA